MSEQINVPGLLEAQSAQPDKRNEVKVSAYNDLVVLHLDKAQEYLPFQAVGAIDTATRMMAFAIQADPATAQLVINAAMAIVDHVYEARGDLKPAGTAIKHEMIERHRSKLTQRLQVMLNSLREKKTTSNHGLAKQMVETMLKEVFQ